MSKMQYYVYILTNQRNTVLYTGITNNIIKRTYQHKNPLDKKSFTSKYNIEKLVYYEITESVESAIKREKQIKSWNRQWKVELIEKMNPVWRDLYQDLIG